MSMVTLKEVQKIKQIFPKTNGLFQHMQYNFRSNLSKIHLDLMFLGEYGNRNPSNMVETVQTTYGEVLSDQDLTLLASLIVDMFKDRWDKLGAIYDIQYDPIHNYLDEWEDTSNETVDRDASSSGSGYTTYGKTESETSTRTDTFNRTDSTDEDKSRTRTDALESETTRDLTQVETRTDALKEETTYGRSELRTDNLSEGLSQTSSGTSTSDTDEKVVPFNANASQLTNESDNDGSHSDTVTGTTTNTGTQTNASSGKDTVDNTGTRTTRLEDDGTVTTENTGTQTIVDDNSITTTQTGTVTRGNTASITHGGRDDTSNSGTESEDISRDRDRSGSHSGNIGNITSQKMLNEEIALWKWNYVREILNDVKEFCTLPVYLHATRYALVDQEED